MRTIFNLVTIGCTLALASAQYQWPDVAPAKGDSFRVFGQSPAAVLVNDLWTSGDLKQESPLPIGYVAPTSADNIEIKSYPGVRRAEFASEHLWMKNVWGINRAFNKLFDHISSRKIPMTSPVEFNFRNMTDQSGFLESDKGDWTMSFLYRTPSLGPAGPAENDVNVVDTKEVTVIAIAFEGDYGNQNYNKGLKQLYAALASQTKWVQAGEPRAFNYNSPFVSNKWGEV